MKYELTFSGLTAEELDAIMTAALEAGGYVTERASIAVREA